MTTRRAFSATLLAMCLTTFVASCGGDQTAGGGPARRPADDSPASGGSGTTAATPGSTERPAAGGAPNAPSTKPSTKPGGGSNGGPGVASRVVYFSSQLRVGRGSEVLRSRADLERFAGKVVLHDPEAAAQITASGGTTDFSRNVLVGWAETTGCSEATAAALAVSGNRLELQVSRPKPLPECDVPFMVTVVFEVPEQRIPAQPVFG